MGAILIVLLSVGASPATVRYVALDGSGTNGQSWATAYRSIDAAVEAASTVAGDEIRVKQGTYGTGATTYVDKAVKIYGGYTGVGDTRDWQGAKTFIDGLFTTTHCFDISANATLDGLNIIKGKANGTTPSDEGGGMYIHQCSPVISNCVFDRNDARYRGGAIYLEDADGTAISNCSFTGNTSSDAAGAIFCNASNITISECQFTGNKTGIGLNDGYGGAIETYKRTPSISECTFTNNSAQYGAGICNYLSSAHVEACSFTDCNTATIGGGGVYNWGGAPVISKCLFQDNHVTHRGGAIFDKSLGTIVNCIMWNNGSMTYGGAVYIDPSVDGATSGANFINCVMYGNSATQGGALYSDNASATLVNCILWGNTSYDEEWPGDIFNSTRVYNRTTVATYCDIAGDSIYAGTGNLFTDPKFVNAPGGDFHLQASSPCIDHGTNSAPNMPTTDYAGRPRISDGNEDGLAVADMGVYETQGYTLTDHVHRGEILEGEVYDNPTDTTAEYTFMAEFETDDDVASIDLRSPAGTALTIPNTDHTTSGNVETRHTVSDGVHTWQYWARFDSAAGLNSYGDGTYIITYHRTGGTTRETRLGYNLEGNAPIPQAKQRPNVTSPAYGASVGSPVTLSWDACTDAAANSVFVTIINVDSDETAAGDNFDKSATSSSAFTLADGTYDAEVSFGNLYDTADSAAVPFEIGKGVTVGHRLVVLYTTVYRFWSPVNSVHFYTISPAERDNLIANYTYVWTYEGAAFHTAATGSQTGLEPVYRFWSGHSHFYTISEDEKSTLVRDWSNVWTLEGVAFYAYPEGHQPEDSKPVYRFWSPINSVHFYTISPAERDNLIANYDYVWTYEGIAFYAYE
jgi:hypothetical protein